jgi:uncharacterized protein
MTDLLRRAGLALSLAAAFFLAGAPAVAAPKFPALSGRVVDEAQILSPQTEAALTTRLADLETRTGRQLVVATLPSLQGYEIEEYGYQLGRAWGIGGKEDDDGALLIVAPKERKVRIEVGYGLEGVLTDALSSVIIQSRIIPKFRAGDMEGGVVDGADAIIAQLALPEGEARATAAKAVPESRPASGDLPFPAILLFIFLVLVISGFGRRRRRRGGLGGALPWIVLSSLANSGGHRGGGWSGGGGGGGGFSGGGGSFGGGGSSGSW